MALRRDGKIDLLEQLPLFSGLGRRHLNVIAGHVDQVKLDAGAVLARQGRLSREFVLLVQGSAQVERDGEIIARLAAGDFFGEFALIEGKPHTATVIADAPVALVVVEARSFSYLLGAVPELQRRLLLGFCGRLREADAAWPGSISLATHQLAAEMSKPTAFPVQP
jgi:CRP-like cAMP-binding protein